MKRALLIWNPAARKAPAYEKLRAALDAASGWEIALEPTAAAGHATDLARRAAADGLDAAIACGGDGTVNEVANGLAGSATALAVVRGGTANVWAKEVRIPKKPLQALRLLTEGETRVIDLGRANERYFLCMAGIGFDAFVVNAVHGGMKRRLGAAAYIAHGIRAAIGYKAVDAQLQIDEQPRTSGLYWMLLGNTRSYGGVVDITRWASVDDGQLDMLLLRKGGLVRLAWFGVLAALRRHRNYANVTYEKIGDVSIATPSLPVHIDGEYVGETPMRFDVAPASLRVIVPRGLASPLFANDPSV